MTAAKRPLPASDRLLGRRPGAIHLVTELPDEASEDKRLPPAPGHLTALAKEEWERVGGLLLERGLIGGELDVAALALYCQAWARWVEAEQALAASGGLLVRTGNGLVPSPLLKVSLDASRQMERLIIMLGMRE